MKELARFRDKVCVISGAGQGIGLATARRMAAEGGTLVLTGLSGAAIEAATAELSAQGTEVLGLICDAGDAAAMTAMFDQVRFEVDKSLWTALVCCRTVLPFMIEQGSGSIVNVGSNSPRGIYRVAYASAKGGVFALTTALSLEVARKGIRINCVAPGATKVGDRITPRSSAAEEAENAQWIDELFSMQEAHIPMGRWGNPDEQAAAIAFMASGDASFITGQILSVGGGLTVP
ncbi:MAG: SDR family oxidoreductase [Streptosporangiaceae bacterium]